VQNFALLVYLEGPTAPPSALDFSLHNICIHLKIPVTAFEIKQGTEINIWFEQFMDTIISTNSTCLIENIIWNSKKMAVYNKAITKISW
jgi:hypothetical protein